MFEKILKQTLLPNFVIGPMPPQVPGLASVLKANPYHDELGRFSTQDNSVAPKELVDWVAAQPRLSMRGTPSDSGKYVAIPLQYAVRSSAYDKDPLGNKVSVPDDTLDSVLAVRLDDMKDSPVEEVSLKTLRNVQGVVSADHFLQNKQGVGLPSVVRIEGNDYLIDGNHRATKAVVAGDKTIKARVLVLDAPAKTNKSDF